MWGAKGFEKFPHGAPGWPSLLSILTLGFASDCDLMVVRMKSTFDSMLSVESV